MGHSKIILTISCRAPKRIDERDFLRRICQRKGLWRKREKKKEVYLDGMLTNEIHTITALVHKYHNRLPAVNTKVRGYPILTILYLLAIHEPYRSSYFVKCSLIYFYIILYVHDHTHVHVPAHLTHFPAKKRKTANDGLVG